MTRKTSIFFIFFFGCDMINNNDMTKKVYKALNKIVKTKLKTSSGCS